MDPEAKMDQITACSPLLFHSSDAASQRSRSNILPSDSRRLSSSAEDMDHVMTEDGLSNGICETIVALHSPGDSGDVGGQVDPLAMSSDVAISNDDMSDFSNSDLSLPEVCISTNSNSFEENMNYEVQMAYRIFTGFLSDKHKGVASPFLRPMGHQEAQHGIGGVCGQTQLKQSMCLKRMEEKFICQEYETITEFVADFRLMLENCYRYHGVDHWISKQAQKLEIMLEQKLTLLSRTLREKTTLSVTSKGRFGAEEERSSGGTSTRRRLAPRSLATITVGGHESLMVQALRLEEQQRAKEEKRQRELEKKEAEEMSAKEVEEWEQSLLSQAPPHTVDTLWELPAIGHFLCLAQTALNLPEIVFFELERCLLMPRCSILLSKIMSSLLSPWQKRATLHRRPALTYRRWESELRHRVMGWYRAVGGARYQPGRAELLGLCYQFFSILGEASPLEEKPFHLLPFYQRVWLLKGLCDHVYETQKDVQDAVLAQPIHECRESILGYDGKENAYIHFPHFCGADLRIYCQSPSTPPAFPFPSVWVKRVEAEPGREAEASDKSDSRCHGGSMDTRECDERKFSGKPQNLVFLKNGDGEEDGEHFKMRSIKKTTSESGSSDGDSCEDSRLDLQRHINSHTSHIKASGEKNNLKEASVALKHEQGLSLGSRRTIKAETEEPCLSVGEHSYTGRSPARSATVASPSKPLGMKLKEGSLSQGPPVSSCLECCESKAGHMRGCCCGTSGHATSSDSTQNSSEERVTDRIWAKRRKWKRKRGRGQLLQGKRERKQLQHVDGTSLDRVEADQPAERRGTTVKRKDKKKKHKTGKKLESAKTLKDEPPVAPTFKLVCTSLEELRELISKTEDELDDLESTKKKLGRWYYRREAVKDLHSTLIRLLNELSPWEPKLVKAYQRNRLRLKKEFDDFKKHPEYNNFVREERSSSSSSSDDEESRLGKETCSLDHCRRSEEEDLDNIVPRGLWSGASTSEFVAECAGERTATFVTPDHQTCPLQTGSSNIPPTLDSGLQSASDVLPSSQSRDSSSANSTVPMILHPTTGLPKGYTPIPTLLAKSVGNKVTLMKRPADCSGIRDVHRQSKGSLVSLPTSSRAATKLSTPQSCTSTAQQNSQLQAQGHQTQLPKQPGMAAVMEELPKSPLAGPTPSQPKSPVQLVYKVPEGLGQLVRKDSSPVKISVHPVLDQKTGEKIMQQVVILPSNLLIHKSEDTPSSTYQHQSKGVQVPVSRVASPLHMSTNVPGFTVPESRIPVQQVAPLKDAQTVKSPSSSISPYVQQGALNTAGFKGAQVCSSQTSTPQAIKPIPWSIKSPTSVASTLAVNSTDSKQELKTVCIRDSQSILVTTRGGNTGIVKVQSSSDQNAPGCVPAGPVITISPEFKAFLISKTLQTSASVPLQSSCSIPVDQPQKQVHSNSAAVTNPVASALSGSIPLTGLESQTGIALSQGPNVSAGSADDSKTVQLAQSEAASCNFQPSFVKSTFVPSLSTFVPQVLTPAESSSKTGLKRASTDETSHVTKFILVSPSSSSASKEAQSSAKPPPGSTVLSVSQTTDTSPTTFVGRTTKQGMATGTHDQLLPTSFSSQSLKTGLNQGQSGSVHAEALSKGKNITVPAGLQIHFPGKTTTIGQTIGALSHSPRKSTSVSFSDTDRSPPPPSTRLLPFTSSNTDTSSSAELASHVTLTHNSPFQGVASITNVPQPGSSTCTSASLTAANVTRGVLPGNSAAQRSPARTSKTIPLVCPAANIQSSFSKEATSTPSPSHLGRNKTQTPIASATTNSSPLTTFATGTVQQRIVLNNSAPLAAGTQIFLNNARFVVPPQGLSPGNHVLIISSPTPQKVPSVSATSTGSAVPPHGGNHIAGTPNGLPALKSALVACTATVGPSLLATAPSSAAVHLTGATLLPSQTRGASALPSWQTSQLSSFALPPVSSAVGSVPLTTSAPGAALSTVRAATSTTTHAPCSSIGSPAVAALARFAAPSSVIPGPPVIALPSPVIPNAPYLQSLPTQREMSVNQGMQAQQTGGTTATATAPSPSFAQMGLSNTSFRRPVPATMQPVMAGPRTHVLPTVAVPPIVSTVSRMQKLPIATVPPIGTTVNIFETAPVVTTPPSSGTVLITVAQPVVSLETNAAVQKPIVLTNQPLGKHSLQASDVGVPPKLLISPDGAVLGTGQCRVNPAEVAGCPKPLAALMVSPNSSNGALHTQDSSLQPSWANTK